MPALPHELYIGTDVFSSDGHKLGELKRVVLKRSDLTLRHVVIDIGLLRAGHHLWEGGLGLDYDRIVPVSAIASTSDERVVLGLTAAEFKDQPQYSEEAFEAPHDITPGEYDITDLAVNSQAIATAFSSTPGAWLVERLNKPLDEVEIAEGMSVWRQEPHEKIGEVERGILDDAGRLSALVVRRGFLLHRDVVLPSRYISEIIDEVSVRVDISDQELEQLKEAS